MNIEMKDLKLVEAPLVGFARGTMCPLGTIKLQLTLGAKPTKATSLVEFLVVDWHWQQHHSREAHFECAGSNNIHLFSENEI